MTTNKCVCAVCEFGPGASEVPKKPLWHEDVFCSVGGQETGQDGQIRSTPGYVRPFFSKGSAPSAPSDCPKKKAHVALMALRLGQAA